MFALDMEPLLRSCPGQSLWPLLLQGDGFRTGVYHAGSSATARHAMHMAFLSDKLDVVPAPPAQLSCRFEDVVNSRKSFFRNSCRSAWRPRS